MGKFIFWEKWLFWSLIVQAMTGVILTFWGPRILFGPIDIYYNQILFGTEVPQESLLLYKWLSGVLGATMASWAVALAFVTHFAFKKKEK